MKPLKTEVAFATPWFQVLAKTMREGEEPYYSLKLPDYAAVVALTEEQRVAHRPSIPPGGGASHPGTAERPRRRRRDAVSSRPRELLEETGYEAGEWELLGGMEPDVGRLGNRIWACLAKNVRPAKGSRRKPASKS